jgi:transcriptional regulator of acetoin/glycerol metabolism
MSDEQRRFGDNALPPSAETAQAPQLVLVHSRQPAPHAQRIRLGRDLLLIGRAIDAGDGISTGDARMSLVHVRIMPDPRSGAHRVADAHSSNGTFVNGLRVDASVLRDGDVLRIGDSVFVYCAHEPMRRALELAEQRALGLQPMLFEGETGSDARGFAERLLARSPRAGETVHVDCAGLTTASISLRGLFERAAALRAQTARAASTASPAAIGGWLILEGWTTCPLDVQAALLRALEEHAASGPSQLGVIAVAEGDLASARAEGRLLAALYEHWLPARIELPPLRARKLELLDLIEALASAPDLPARAAALSLQLDANAAEALLLWSWPGNLSELQKLLADAASAHPGRALDMNGLRELAPLLAAPVLSRKRAGHSPVPR